MGAGGRRPQSEPFWIMHKLALTARTHIAGGASTGVLVPRSRPVGECRRAFVRDRRDLDREDARAAQCLSSRPHEHPRRAPPGHRPRSLFPNAAGAGSTGLKSGAVHSLERPRRAA
jgi:hypothetical protein